MTEKDVILNAQTPSGAAPCERIDIALRKAIADLQAEFFDLDEGKIDYPAMGGTESFNTYVAMTGLLAGFDLTSLQTREERLAFWINLYNTMVVHGVVELGIERSVKEKAGFFDRLKYDVGGHVFSLNDIEHGILRENRRVPYRLRRSFGRDDPRQQFVVSPMDVRIHFALVCGSQSCPPIGFYTAEKIDEQLDLAAQSFINSDEIRIDPPGRTLRVSMIFKWYQRDFGSKDHVIRFITRYLDPGEKRAFVEKHGQKTRVRYRPYDWSLNH